MAIIGNEILKAKSLLEKGELVAIPTETVYGLAANAFNVDAVLKIYEVKNRPKFNPLIIHSSSINRFQKWGIVITDKLKKLADAFSPGPITYVVNKSDQIPDIITAGQDSVAIRVPNHKTAIALLSIIDFPLAAPSANPSEYVSPTTAFHVQAQLNGKISYVLDGGACEIGVESTIVDLRGDKVRLLRLGGISKEEIEEVLGEEIEDLLVSDNIIAPGMMKRHYATQHPLVFENSFDKNLITENTYALRFSSYSADFPEDRQFILSKSGDLKEAAANLFSTMRKMDSIEMDLIVAEKFPSQGIGRAINDRLERAASKNLHS